MPPVADPIDVEALLAPIPGENPSGESLRHTLYDEVKESRRSDDNLEQGIWKHDVKTADWGNVVRLTRDALAARTKDVNVACWLAEGLTYQNGYAGLRAGLRVLAGILDRFWETAYPEIDAESPGEEFLARANSLEDFDRKIAFAVAEVPVTRSSGPPLNARQWEESRPFDVGEAPLGPVDAEVQARLVEMRQLAEAEHKVSGEEFRKARETTPKAWYVDTLATVGECREALSTLQSVIDSRFGNQAFGLREFEKMLAAVHALLEKTLKEKRVLEPDPIEGGDAEGAGAGDDGAGEVGGAASGHGTGTGPIRSREDALRRLTEAAEYLRRTEPQSPVPFLIQRAVSWARMPLDGWLTEVVKDQGTLESIRELLAVRADGG